MLSFSEKTREHQTEIGVLLWVRLTKLKKAKTMKAIMALQVGDWAALLTMIQQMCHKLTIKTYVEVQRIQEQSWHCKLVTGVMCSAFPADFLDNVSAGTSNGKNTLRLKSQKWGKNSQKVIKELNRKNWLTKND